MSETHTHGCARAAELVSYSYGEADTAARRRFEEHLQACPACRAELADFAHVRASMRVWHTELLTHAPALAAHEPEFAQNGRPAALPIVAAAAPPPRRAAWTALREFCTLTPLWLRAGLSFAALVVCALAVLAVVNADVRWDSSGVAFRTGWGRPAPAVGPADAAPAAPAQTRSPADAPDAAELALLTAERDAARHALETARRQLDAHQQQVATLNASLAQWRAVAQRPTLARTSPSRSRSNTDRPTAATGTRQLATVNEPDEDGLRLSDLLTQVSGSAQPASRRNQR